MLRAPKETLSLPVARLLTPEPPIGEDPQASPTLRAHAHRANRLRSLPGYRDIQREVVAQRLADLPFMTKEGILDTFADTQFLGENHRRLTPRLQEMLYHSNTHEELIKGIDEACERDTDKLIEQARRSVFLTYDVAILGSGPHGAAAAMTLRERFPDLRTIMIDNNPQLGGQWRSYGPNAAFWMNSRVRRANRSLRPLPRTPGSINPLGEYATLELSDVVTGNYATNTEMGEITAANAYLAVDSTFVNGRCTDVVEKKEYALLYLQTASGETVRLRAGALIDATGIVQTSALRSFPDRRQGSYLSTAGLYRHFGSSQSKIGGVQPLEKFHDRTAIVVGGGDSALTSIEALLGNLPAETYGQYGPGRLRPAEIIWVGAPGERAQTIDPCLRSRYKNGIIQALPKYDGDEGALITPYVQKAGLSFSSGEEIEVQLEGGKQVFGNVLIDCTNSRASYRPLVPIDRSREEDEESRARRVGPGANPKLPKSTKKAIAKLGIPENTASLWALMELTDRIALEAGRVATQSKARR
jgi:hypothetical protein